MINVLHAVSTLAWSQMSKAERVQTFASSRLTVATESDMAWHGQEGKIKRYDTL